MSEQDWVEQYIMAFFRDYGQSWGEVHQGVRDPAREWASPSLSPWRSRTASLLRRHENLIVAWAEINSRERVKKVCHHAVEAYNLVLNPSSQIVRLERASLFARPGVGQGAILLSFVEEPRQGGYGTKHLHPV